MIGIIERLFLFKLYSLYNDYRTNFLKRYLIYRYRHSAEIHSSVRIGTDTHFNVNSKGRLVIGEDVVFRYNCQVLVYGGGNVHIGRNVFMNNFCSVNCLGLISIGENTILGEAVRFYDHNHRYETSDSSVQVKRGEFNVGQIVIGKNCWIGSNVTILNNVVIGDNVIIGANNLIYESIPANTVVKANTSYTIHQLGPHHK